VANLIDLGHEADVGLDEDVVAIGIDSLELGLDLRAPVFGAAKKVDARPVGESCELFEGAVADAVGCADEDGYEPRGQLCSDSGVGVPYYLG